MEKVNANLLPAERITNGKSVKRCGSSPVNTITLQLIKSHLVSLVINFSVTFPIRCYSFRWTVGINVETEKKMYLLKMFNALHFSITAGKFSQLLKSKRQFTKRYPCFTALFVQCQSDEWSIPKIQEQCFRSPNMNDYTINFEIDLSAREVGFGVDPNSREEDAERHCKSIP